MEQVIEVITKLIGSVGFPIACCIIMFIQNSKLRDTLNENTQVLKDLSNEIKGRTNKEG